MLKIELVSPEYFDKLTDPVIEIPQELIRKEVLTKFYLRLGRFPEGTLSYKDNCLYYPVFWDDCPECDPIGYVKCSDK